MTEQFVPDQDPRAELKAAIAERVIEQLGRLQAIARIVGGPDATVEDVFAPPVVEGGRVRDDAPMPDWTAEQIEGVQSGSRHFGYGAQETVVSGIAGGIRLNEGGLVWKMMAENEALKDEELALAEVGEEVPHTVVFCGSPLRPLGEKERTFLAKKHDTLLPETATEYDFALILARQRADKSVADEPITQPFGYETTRGNPMIIKATGQLAYVGESTRDQNILAMQVAGEKYLDDNNEDKERNRPDTTRVITWFAEKLTAEGKLKDPIVFGTSNTYASRVPDTIRASLELDPPRQLGVVLYGRATIGALGAPVPKEMPLHQLPGDLRVMHDKLLQLGAAVGVQWPPESAS